MEQICKIYQEHLKVSEGQKIDKRTERAKEGARDPKDFH